MKKHLLHLIGALLLVSFGLPAIVYAQNNSPQAIEAVKRHRAETAGQTQNRAGPAQNRAYRSGGDPSANPDASLKSCLNHYDGMNLAARTRCFNQHCKGRWGQGDCPQGADLNDTSGSSSNTPLGQCLREAGANPFKRDSCGWRHCNRRWDAPECAALHPKRAQPYGNN